MASKALRGLGEGLALAGGALVQNSLAMMREQAIAELRAEYGMKQAKFESGERDRQIALKDKLARERDAADNDRADKRHDKTLASEELRARISAGARDKDFDASKYVRTFERDKFNEHGEKVGSETWVEIKSPDGRVLTEPYSTYQQRLRALDSPQTATQPFLPEYLDPSRAPASPNAAPPATPTGGLVTQAGAAGGPKGFVAQGHNPNQAMFDAQARNRLNLQTGLQDKFGRAVDTTASAIQGLPRPGYSPYVRTR